MWCICLELPPLKLGKSKYIQLQLHTPSCWTSKTGNQFCRAGGFCMNDFSDCTCVDQIQHISLGSGGSASNEKRYMTRKNQSPNTWWFMVLNRKKWSMYGITVYLPKKSSLHVRKYISPMDPSWFRLRQFFVGVHAVIQLQGVTKTRLPKKNRPYFPLFHGTPFMVR